ncbi:DUF1634 domain-containing protein [Mucilaginibacter sp.]
MAGKAVFKDTDMQVIIGWVLRIGVIVSISVVFFGGFIYLYRHGESVPNYTKFTGVPDFVQLNGIIPGILNFRGRSIIQAGIILLIATPIVRIVFSAISFILEKDYLYIGISLLVLLIIILSSISGHAAG